MKNKNKKTIYNIISQKHNTTPEAVRNEIQNAMKIAMSDSDPAVQQKWDSIPKAGEELTPEELIDYIVNTIKNNPS